MSVWIGSRYREGEGFLSFFFLFFSLLLCGGVVVGREGESQ